MSKDLKIRAAIGGEGPPVLLLHGHPQTHVTWRKVAPVLARYFTVYSKIGSPAGGASVIYKDVCLRYTGSV